MTTIKYMAIATLGALFIAALPGAQHIIGGPSFWTLINILLGIVIAYLCISLLLVAKRLYPGLQQSNNHLKN